MSAVNGVGSCAAAAPASPSQPTTLERGAGVLASPSVPRISRLLALALRMEQMIEDGTVAMYKRPGSLGPSLGRAHHANHEPVAPGARHSRTDLVARRSYFRAARVCRAEAECDRALERATSSMAGAACRHFCSGACRLASPLETSDPTLNNSGSFIQACGNLPHSPACHE